MDTQPQQTYQHIQPDNTLNRSLSGSTKYPIISISVHRKTMFVTGNPYAKQYETACSSRLQERLLVKRRRHTYVSDDINARTWQLLRRNAQSASGKVSYQLVHDIFVSPNDVVYCFTVLGVSRKRTFSGCSTLHRVGRNRLYRCEHRANGD